MMKILQNRLLASLILIAVIIFAVTLLWRSGVLTGQEYTYPDTYQAVFLTNGQVYFGKISNLNSDYPILRDIYYLQVTQAIQPPDPDNPQPQLQLVKLGSEIHGPLDEMKINKNHILFVEELKETSQVVVGIRGYQRSVAPSQ